MSRRFLVPLVAGLLLALPLALRAEHHEREDEDGDGRGRVSAHGQGKEERGDSSLEDVMEEMSEAYRTLRRQVTEPAKNPSSLRLAATLHQLAERASTLQPRMVRHAPREEQAALLASYKARMRELVATIGDLEEALKAGKNSAAADLVDDIKELQRSGHRKFRTEN